MVLSDFMILTFSFYREAANKGRASEFFFPGQAKKRMTPKSVFASRGKELGLISEGPILDLARSGISKGCI